MIRIWFARLLDRLSRACERQATELYKAHSRRQALKVVRRQPPLVARKR